jgi:predicted enzyme related to lactoylglutathione lyase
MSAIGWTGEATAAIEVSDYERSLAWYRDILGFTVLYEMKDIGWAEFATPVGNLHLGIGQSEKVREGGGATLTFGVDDIDAVRARLEAAGVRFDGEAIEFEGMVRLATFFDPDGNSLMLFQMLQQPES